VAVARFTGTIGASERIIDMGGGAGVNNLLLTRSGTASDLRIDFYDGSNNQIIHSILSGVIVQNTWMTAMVRYRASTREWWFTANGVASAGTASASLVDRTMSSTYMGKSWWSNDYLNGDIAGVFVVDEYLSTAATSAIADFMKQGVDLTTSGSIAVQAGLTGESEIPPPRVWEAYESRM
jgi:hypothetical protein